MWELQFKIMNSWFKKKSELNENKIWTSLTNGCLCSLCLLLKELLHELIRRVLFIIIIWVCELPAALHGSLFAFFILGICGKHPPRGRSRNTHGPHWRHHVDPRGHWEKREGSQKGHRGTHLELWIWRRRERKRKKRKIFLNQFFFQRDSLLLQEHEGGIVRRLGRGRVLEDWRWMVKKSFSRPNLWNHFDFGCCLKNSVVSVTTNGNPLFRFTFSRQHPPLQSFFFLLFSVSFPPPNLLSCFFLLLLSSFSSFLCQLVLNGPCGTVG